MKSFTLITALLLCSLSWISVSGSGSQTVEVQPGGEVTLQCSNVSNYDSQTYWYRLDNRKKLRCVSVMIRSKSNASFCDGFQNGNFEMSSNLSHLFLKINQSSLSDSGLYFCGFFMDGSVFFNATQLNIKGSDGEDTECNKESGGITKLTSVILGAVTVVLVLVIIGLVLAKRKIQTAYIEEQDPESSQNVASDDLNYASVAFQPKAKRRAMEPNVIYAATR